MVQFIPGEAWAFDGNMEPQRKDFIELQFSDLEFRTNNINRRLTQSGQIELLNTGSSVFVGKGAGNSDDLLPIKMYL